MTFLARTQVVGGDHDDIFSQNSSGGRRSRFLGIIFSSEMHWTTSDPNVSEVVGPGASKSN